MALRLAIKEKDGPTEACQVAASVRLLCRCHQISYLHVAPCLAHHPYRWPLHLLTVQCSQQEGLLSTALSLHNSHKLVSTAQSC